MWSQNGHPGGCPCRLGALAGGQEMPKAPRPPLRQPGQASFPHHGPAREAQKYFDQGMTLLYGFNHPEAIRSFQAGRQLDPDCAMAYWGVAFAYGPNINAPMERGGRPEGLRRPCRRPWSWPPR